MEQSLKKTIQNKNDKKLEPVLEKMLSIDASKRPSLKEIKAEVELLYPELLVFKS